MNIIKLTALSLFLLIIGCSGDDQRQPGWTSPQPIGNAETTISTPAINSNGDVLVNYISKRTMYLNIYHQKTGWDRELRLGMNIYPGRLSLNDAGQGIFVYCDTIDGVISQKAIIFSPTSGWGIPQTIRSGVFSSSSAWAAMAPNGDCMVAWRETDFVNGDSIYTAYYRQGVGWATPVRLSNLTTNGDVFFAGITVNGSGKYLALWTERNNVSMTSTCYKSIFDPASGWNSPELLLSGVGDRVFTMSDMDADGNVAVSLSWTDGAGRVETYFGRIGLNLSLELMSQPITDTSSESVQMNSRGDAFVAWGAGEFPNPRIQGINYVHRNGWGTITTVQKNMATSSLRGDFSGLDDYGNIFVAGLVNVDTTALLSVTRYSPGSGWGKPVVFTTDQQILFFFPSLVVSRGGKAALVWTVQESTSAIAKAYISFYK